MKWSFVSFLKKKRNNFCRRLPNNPNNHHCSSDQFCVCCSFVSMCAPDKHWSDRLCWQNTICVERFPSECNTPPPTTTRKCLIETSVYVPYLAGHLYTGIVGRQCLHPHQKKKPNEHPTQQRLFEIFNFHWSLELCALFFFYFFIFYKQHR